MIGTAYSIRCEPNTLRQSSYVQPGGLSKENLRNGGTSTVVKGDVTRLYRDTSFTCQHSKKWENIMIAQPNTAFDNKTIIGHLSDNGASLMVEFNPRLIEKKELGVRNLEMPLTSFDHYCVSYFHKYSRRIQCISDEIGDIRLQ